MLKSDKNYGKAKERINQIFEEEGYEAGKKAQKDYKRKKRLNNKNRFVLNMLSHYRFRQHLIHKANEYGCKVDVITEEHTSITCTKCGKISNKYDYREKECENCGYKIDRDVNGSLNILIKNIKNYLKVDGTELENSIVKQTTKLSTKSLINSNNRIDEKANKNPTIKVNHATVEKQNDMKIIKQPVTKSEGKIIIDCRKKKSEPIKKELDKKVRVKRNIICEVAKGRTASDIAKAKSRKDTSRRSCEVK